MIYQVIKNFLNEGGKCLLIEDGKPIGVVLTMEEYEKLKSPTFAEASAGKQITNYKFQKEEKIEKKEEVKPEAEQLLIPRINSEPINSINPIGAVMVEEMSFPSASADFADINFADAGDVTLEDLGLDELPY